MKKSALSASGQCRFLFVFKNDKSMMKKSNKLKAMKKDRKINENKIMKRLIKVRNTGSGI